MGKTIDIGGRIHNSEVGNVVTGANEILDDTKNKKQDVINSEVDAALEALDANKQDNLTFDQTPTESSTNPVTSGGVYAADLALQQAIEAILTLIPSAASALNQLADKSFVNSSIATASATFRGTYNLVSDLHLSVTASHQDIATALASAASTADNNDYCFVQIPTSDTSSDIRVTERYKFNGTAWAYEYDLNNSGFTATQWEAINSGITALLVTKLGALPTAAELATSLAGKQNVLTFDNVPVSGSDNPVKSGGLYQLFTAIDAKFPSDASSSNKLVAENRLAAYVTAIIEALDASFDITSADGHVTFRMTQTNGVIASVQILTSDIASASALTTLGGQVSTNASDIAALESLYNALQQSAPQVIQPSDTWPVANPSTTVIYRVIDRVNTPPQFYSDYMWNGSAWVLMATYNNAIDDLPIDGSNNLVRSGGVFYKDRIIQSLIFDIDNITIRGTSALASPQTGLLVRDGSIDASQSNYSTYTYTNNGSTEVYLFTNRLATFGNFGYYVNLVYMRNSDVYLADKELDCKIIRVLPGCTVKLSTNSGATAPYLVTSCNALPQLRDDLLGYIRKMESYNNHIVLNIYYNNGWKIAVNAGYISLTAYKDSNWYNLSSEIINATAGVVADLYASWYYLTYNTSTHKFDLYTQNDIWAALYADASLQIVGYGNLNNYGKDFITTFPIQVEGKMLYKNVPSVPSGIDIMNISKQRLFIYKGGALCDVYFDSGNWKIEVYQKYYNLINKDNGARINPDSWLQTTAETLTMNLSYTASDPGAYLYYLLFDISTKKPKLVTNVEIASEFISQNIILLGYGILGADVQSCLNFECTVPIKFNHIEVKKDWYSEQESSIISKKKVLWVGTSISEVVGNVEAVFTLRSCKNVGRDCINVAKGSSYLTRRYTPETLTGVPTLDYSLSQTIAEYEEMYRPYVTQGLMTEETLNSWKSCSYENLIIPHLSEIDTIIFEHGYNDPTAVTEADNPDWSSYDKTTFVGAFNFLMAEIFKVNPFIKIIIVPYFQNKINDAQKSLESITKCILMSRKISDKFGYPYLPIHDYCPFDGYYVPNTSNYDFVDNIGNHHNKIWQDSDGNARRFQLYCPDGVHPYSAQASTYLESVYTKLLVGII